MHPLVTGVTTMTITMPARELDRLSQSGLSTADLENLDEDLVGRPLYDRLGEEIGSVDDLLVSRQLLRAPFVVVRWGGLLGIGRQMRLVPVETLERVAPDAVYVGLDREVVTASPAFRDDLEGDDAELQYASVYAHYGLAPYWEPMSNR